MPSRRRFLQAASAAPVAWNFAALRPLRAALPAVSTDREGPIHVGGEKQLFFDDRFIDRAENVAVVMNPPLKRGPVVEADRPWEDFRLTSYFTVVQDGELARMYYSCFAEDQWNHPDDPWKNHAGISCN